MINLFRKAAPPLGLSGLLLAWVGTVHGQVAHEPKALALPTALHHAGLLRGYQAYAEPPATPWREANDRVARIGGWRAYAKEIQSKAAGPDAAASAHPAGRHSAAKP